MTITPSWFVFDLGGVLVDVEPAENTLERLGQRIGATPEALAGLLDESHANGSQTAAARFQIGDTSLDDFLAAINAIAVQPIERDTLVTELNAMLRGVHHDTRAVVADLVAAGHHIACYSNTNPVQWSYIQRECEFFDDITEPFASHVVGYAKPDIEGYARVADALGAEPAECILIDDRAPNVAGAWRAGWQAHHFTGAAALRQALDTLGLKLGASA